MEDTIAAISTAQGVGAISIVRVSGPEALQIINKIWRGKNLCNVPTHTIHYGHIVDNDLIVDEVLVSVMRGSNTFTGEDIVEINCHGGIISTNKILELCLSNGCRLAERGEFTKRRFLNGKIDLSQAEGVMDLLRAETEEQQKIAINKLSGNVSSLIRDLRDQLIKLIANIEVNIDYPEYDDVEEITLKQILPMMDHLEIKMKKILKESKNGQLLQNGIKTAIIGKPNVGKSSLLNALLEEKKAIVTSVAGTTRDIVEGKINLDGLILNIIDTAGIRNTTDVVEQIGVEKSLQIMKDADLVLLVLNNNDEISEAEFEILKALKDKNCIIIINKIDLDTRIDLNKIEYQNIIKMSIEKRVGIDELKNEIKKLFNLEKIKTGNYTYLTTAREIGLLKEAQKSLEDVKKGILNKMPIDMIEIDLKNIWNLLGEMIGETYEEELIDQLFSQFCLGK